MADFPTNAELFDIARDEMLLRNDRLSADVIDTPGTDANAICATSAAVSESVVRQVARVARDRLLSTARKDALDQIVWDWYGLLRNDASVAVVTLRFQRPAPGAGGSIDAGFVCSTASGVQFETDSAAVFGGATLSVDVLARAVIAGVGGNVAAASITQLGAAVFDATITVTNPAIAAGGAAAETDDAFRARAQAFWGVARRGTLSAIEFGAMEVDGIGTAEAAETTLQWQGTDVARFVSMAVADGNGDSNAALADEVELALDEWRPCGVLVEVIAATKQTVSVVFTCAFVSGVDTVAVLLAARQAVVSLINALKVGEKLVVGTPGSSGGGAIYEVIRQTEGVATNSVVVTVPAGDVVPATTSIVLRTTLADVQGNQ